MLKSKAWSGGTDEEYETQLFGFGAQRFKISIRQMIEEKIRSGVKDMESSLQELLDLNETDKTTLSHSCDKLIRMYCERSEPSLEAIDSEIDRILKVPSNVLLPEDEVQSQQATHEDHEQLKQEVAELRKRVERGALMLALLTAEEEEISSIENVCESAKKDMKVLDLIYKDFECNNSVNAVNNETKSLCSNVPSVEQTDEIDLGLGDEVDETSNYEYQVPAEL